MAQDVFHLDGMVRNGNVTIFMPPTVYRGYDNLYCIGKYFFGQNISVIQWAKISSSENFHVYSSSLVPTLFNVARSKGVKG